MKIAALEVEENVLILDSVIRESLPQYMTLKQLKDKHNSKTLGCSQLLFDKD